MRDTGVEPKRERTREKVKLVQCKETHQRRNNANSRMIRKIGIGQCNKINYS